MKVIARLSAFSCGVVAVIVAHAIAGSVDARTSEDGAIYACADAEGIMRRTGVEVPCGPGGRRVILKTPEITLPCDERPRRDLTDLQRRVAELEARVDYSRLSSPVIAPFEVVNHRGQFRRVPHRAIDVVFFGGNRRPGPACPRGDQGK